MLTVWAEEAREDYQFWQLNDRATSRRITHEHRLVYQIREDQLRIAACRFHDGV